MVSQEIKPISDGVELKITDSNGDTYTIVFHCQPNEELHVTANADDTFNLKRVKTDGSTTELGLDPSGGSTTVGQ